METRAVTFQLTGGIESLSAQDLADFERLFKKAGFVSCKIFGTNLGPEREIVWELEGPGADASVMED